MSRTGKKPLPIPEGVEVTVHSNQVNATGDKGSLSISVPESLVVSLKDNCLVIKLKKAGSSTVKLGLYRSLISNMFEGVSKGFKKELELVGVGYRAKKEENGISMRLGFSHPVLFTPPQGVEISLEGETKLMISGVDKQKVGQVAATIRKLRPPEPYKGKGIRFVGEIVRKKAGKAGKVGGGFGAGG